MFDCPARMKTLMPFGSLSQVWNWAVPLPPSGSTAAAGQVAHDHVVGTVDSEGRAEGQGDGLAVPAERCAGHRDRAAAVEFHGVVGRVGRGGFVHLLGEVQRDGGSAAPQALSSGATGGGGGGPRSSALTWMNSLGSARRAGSIVTPTISTSFVGVPGSAKRSQRCPRTIAQG